jgi:hypothetical protein
MAEPPQVVIVGFNDKGPILGGFWPPIKFPGKLWCGRHDAKPRVLA